MAEKTLRSRILENFEPELLKAIYKVCKNSVISDNNLKADTMLNILRQYGKDFTELGPGTNRLAILIDNYVFKIALDKWGLQDNWNEFTMTHELQPYVIKVYECNGLIAVTEYVTVISREEFEDKKEEIKSILSILAEGYLLGDVGTISKNFLNWGYRDNGDLVILDFAYIYRVRGNELLCDKCNTIVQYDENFHNLLCPSCHRKYTFIELRKKIPMEDEMREIFMAKQLAYKLEKPIQKIQEKDMDSDIEESTGSSLSNRKNSTNEEENEMKFDKYSNFEEEKLHEESYYDVLNLFKSKKITASVCERPAGEDEEVKKALEENEVKIINEADKIIADADALVQEEFCSDKKVENKEPEETKCKEIEVTISVVPQVTVECKEQQEEQTVETECDDHQEDQPVEIETTDQHEEHNSEEQPVIKYPEVENKTSSLKVFLSGESEECNNEEQDKTDGADNEAEAQKFFENYIMNQSEQQQDDGRAYHIDSTIVAEVPEPGPVKSTNQLNIDSLREQLRTDAEAAEDFNDPYEHLYEESERLRQNNKQRKYRRKD